MDHLKDAHEFTSRRETEMEQDRLEHASNYGPGADIRRIEEASRPDPSVIHGGKLSEDTMRVIAQAPAGSWRPLHPGYEAPQQPQRWAKTPESAIDEAKRIIGGDRRDSYGHPLENHSTTAEMVSAYFRRKGLLVQGKDFTAEDVCMFNILQKAARHANVEDREHIVDIIGYGGNIDICKLRRDELTPPK